MKKFMTICTAFMITVSVCAQAPDKMSYQAVIRNSSNALVTNSSIGIRMSVIQGSPSGAVVYSEIYNPNPVTNDNGLLSIEIGGGDVVTGTFSDINWANGPFFIKAETDPTGGTDYTIEGISQLLSVPYALHAKNTDAWQMKAGEVYTNYKLKINDNTAGRDLLLKVEGNFNPLISLYRTDASSPYIDREWWIGTNAAGSFRIFDNTSGTARFSIDINGKTTINDILNLTPRTTTPSSPSKGDIYFDEALNNLRVWDGTAWQNCW